MKRLIRRFSRGLVLLGVGVSVLASGLAYAATNTINGCVLSGVGQVRIIDPSKEPCKTNETPVSWSQTGPQGPPGPQGPTGAQGPTGPAGGLNSVQVVSATAMTPPNSSFATAFINCPAGTTLTGGGADILGLVGDADGFGPRIISSRPFNVNQWLAVALSPPEWRTNGNNTQWQVDAFALCAKGN